jgi:hypothetical protein
MRIYYNYSYEKNPNICRSNLYADWLKIKKGNEETDGVTGRVKGELLLDGKVLTSSEIDEHLEGATGVEFGLFEEDVCPENYSLEMIVIGEKEHTFRVGV